MIVKYINSQGTEIMLSEAPYYLTTETDITDYEYKFENDKYNMSSLYKEISERGLPIAIKGGRDEDKNRLHEVFDIDCITNKTGRLYIGDYFIEVYVNKSEKPALYVKENTTVNNFTCLVVSKNWIRENTTLFIKQETQQEGLNFPFNFPFDFSHSTVQNETLYNDHFVSSHFKIIINGYVDSPEIIIGDNIYRVNVVVEDGEYLTIDSMTRQIFKNKIDGSIENCFKYRNTRNYIFEKVKAGNQHVIWGDFDFEITLYNERSEPIWT